MYLIPKESVYVDEYFTKFLPEFKLLGFWPCSDDENYYSCHSQYGNIVPVFLGYCEDFWFQTDSKDMFDKDKYIGDNKWILFFMGCDDGSTGMRFNSEGEAIEFLNNCRDVDFAKFLHRYYKDKNCGYKLEFYN